MSRDRQREVVGFDATAVVNHAHQGDAALLERHIDSGGAAVESVFEQLFDNAGGSLHDLSGCNAIDYRYRQLMNSCHACTPASRPPSAGQGS